MSKIVRVQCTNTNYCNHMNEFPLDDLVSGLALVNSKGEVVNPHPEVEVDARLIINCEKCNYPISCADAITSN